MINKMEYYKMLLACGIVSLLALCVFCSESHTGGGAEAGNAKITGMITGKAALMKSGLNIVRAVMPGCVSAI